MSCCLTFSKLLQTIELNHCKLLLVEKKKRKEKETPQVPQNENKSKLLNPPETPRIQKEILRVKRGGVYCKIITYNVGDSATLWWEGWVVVKSADMCYSLPPELIWFCCT